MPKQSISSRLNQLARKYGADFSVDGEHIYCNRCGISFRIIRGKEFYIEQHSKSKGHKEAFNCPARQP